MDYEKAYKEALERAKNLYEDAIDMGENIRAKQCEIIFPELAETEDEKNVKDLIDELKCSLRAANCQNDACNGGHEKRIALLEWAIAWVEKQSKTSPVLSNSLNTGKNEWKISPKWSKEDEEEFKIAIETLHEAGQHSSAMWLKSIKQRLEEQQ